MNQKSIAIVGAGLSGLICARILQRNGVAVVVLELEEFAGARRQGGSLDIHEDTGQIALTEAGLYEEFLAHIHAGGEAMRVMDKRARVYIDEVERAGGNGRPEIDRTTLRRIILDSLEPETVRWNSRVVEVRASGSGHEVLTADGAVVRADLVIGADGAWSRVRTALSEVKPEYTGVTLVELQLTHAVTRFPHSYALVGEGSLYAMSNNKYIGGHGGETLALACGLRVAEGWHTSSEVNWDDPEQVRELLLSEYSDWAPELTDLIQHSDSFWARPIYALPTGYRWNHVEGITIVGDASHLMSPFAGEGANLALIDGADLARAIISATDLDAAVLRHEKAMVRRATRSARASSFGLGIMFSRIAPLGFIAFFTPAVVAAKLRALFLNGRQIQQTS